MNVQRLKEVHQLNLYLTYGIIVLIIGSLIFSKGFSASFLYMVIGLAVAAVSTVVYFVPMHDRIKGLLFAGIPATVVAALFLLDGYALNKHYILIFTIIMVVLYFDEKLILLFSGLISVYMIGLYIINSDHFIGPNNHLAQFLTIFFLTLGSAASLYYLTKAGHKLLSESQKKAGETERLFGQLESLLQTVEVGAEN